MCFGGGGGGSSTATATIPDELKPLISQSAQILMGFQPQAAEFLQKELPLPGMQIAPMSDLEQSLLGGAAQGVDLAKSVYPGFYSAAGALSLDPRLAPLTALAGTPATPTEAQAGFRNQVFGGLATAMTPTAATPAEGQAWDALSLLPQVAAQGTPTPPAELRALSQLDTLTGGPLGSAPATQAAISFLENQYQTRSLPALQNQLALAGLGRSGALEQGITDLRGQLLGAEVPLLQQEVANRAQGVQALSEIAKGQAFRSEAPIQRALSALTTQAGGMQNLAQFERTGQQAPLDRELGFRTSLLAPLLQGAQFQSEQQQLPINRQISTALSSVPAYSQVGQGQLELAKLAGGIGALPRDLQQQQLTADFQNRIRFQNLAESVTTGILGGGVLPSTFGQTIKQSGGGGGLFGK